MAPEVIRGERAILESDLYAVGALLYELVTGTTPFAGGSSIEILCRHLEDDVVRANVRYPDRTIPLSFELVIAYALEKQPSLRFRSALAFASTLRAVTPATEPAFVAMPALSSPDAPTIGWRPGTAGRVAQRMRSHGRRAAC